MRKKIFILAWMLISTLVMMGQKGEKSIGFNLGYNTTMENLGWGLRFQYNIENRFRIAPNFNYYFRNDAAAITEICLDGHYLFPLKDNFVFYPLIGVNYTCLSYDNGMNDDTGIGLDFGLGIQVSLTKEVKLNAELKKSVLYDLDDFEVGCISLSYSF